MTTHVHTHTQKVKTLPADTVVTNKKVAGILVLDDTYMISGTSKSAVKCCRA